MDNNTIQKYVRDRCMAAQTYLDHGLLTESREIFSQICTNLSHLKKNQGDSTELSEWFDAVEIDLREKLTSLNQKIDSRHNSKAPPAGAAEIEEENPKTLYLKGIGLKELGFLDDAMALFKRALEKGHPAYECLKEVIEVLKQNEEWYHLAGEIKGSFGKYEMSDEERGELWRKLGALYEKSHLNEQASDAFKKADEFALVDISAESKKPPKAPSGENEIPMDEQLTEVISSILNCGDDAVKEEAIDTRPDLTEPIALSSKSVSNSQPYSGSSELRALQEENERLKEKLEQVLELSSEYQKRYQSIMSKSNALQKENKALREKLEKQGVFPTLDKK
jgi:tetratricopeptide (TPR) repeat protein